MNETCAAYISYKEIRYYAKQLLQQGRLFLLSVILVYKFASSVIFMQLIRMLFGEMMKHAAVPYITSGNLSAVLQSVWLIPAVLLIGILVAFWAFYEYSLLIHALDAASRGEEIGLTALLCISFSDIRHVFFPKNWPMLFAAALMVPLTNVFMTSDFIVQLEVPEYIMEVIRDTPLYFFAYAAFFGFMVVLLFFWMFAFHIFILEKQSFLKSVKASFCIVKTHLRCVLVSVVRWNLRLFARYLLLAVLFFCICFGSLLALLLLGQKHPELMRALGAALSYTVIPFIGFLFSCLFTIGQFVMLSALYYSLRGENAAAPLSPGALCKKMKLGRKRTGSSAPLWVTVFGALGLTAFLGAGFFFMPELLQMKPQATVTSHRGYSAAAPENTLPAFQAAIDAGADCAELDVQMTKDGVVVVTHDTNLKRCTGTDVNVYDITWEELQKLDAGSWFSEEFAETRIPSLDEAIKLCKGKIRLNIEIKQNGHSPALEAETARIIRENGFADECSVTSLDYGSLEKIKEAAPEIRTGYILALGVGEYYDLPAADYFSVEATFVTAGMVEAIHARGKTISAWTIDRKEDAERMLKLGVDDLITGKPEMVREAVGSQEDFGTFLWNLLQES